MFIRERMMANPDGLKKACMHMCTEEFLGTHLF